MKRPSNKLTMQTVTIFTPVPSLTTKPVNGGDVRTWNKTLLTNVRYTMSEDNALHLTVYDPEKFPSIYIGQSIIILGAYVPDTPPVEGTDTHYYMITFVKYNYADNGQLHNIGVDAR